MAEQYPNRTDLQNPAQKIAKSAAKGQTYGKAAEQMRAQEAVPMAKAPTDTVAMSAPTPVPGQIADLAAPTNRPNEPITTGMPFGPGAGPEIMGPPLRPEAGSNLDLAERVRAVAALYPNAALLQLLMDLEA